MRIKILQILTRQGGFIMPRKKLMTYQTENKAFAKAIKELMKEHNLTREQLGKILGVARQTVSQYATGQSTPDVDIIYRIKEKFNVSADYILGYAEAKNPDNEIINKKLGINESACEHLQNYIKENPINKKSEKIKMLNYIIKNIDDDFLEILYNYLFHDIEITENHANNKVLLCACNADNHDLYNVFYNTTLSKYFYANLLEKLSTIKNNIDKGKTNG